MSESDNNLTNIAGDRIDYLTSFLLCEEGDDTVFPPRLLSFFMNPITDEIPLSSNNDELSSIDVYNTVYIDSYLEEEFVPTGEEFFSIYFPKEKEVVELKFDEAEAKIDEECSVCLLNFEENEKIASLKCSHRFHKNCITEWGNVKNTCPVCRCVIPMVEEKNILKF